MEDTYFSWAQRLIGLGVVLAVFATLFVPRGYRLFALLSLPAGAVVGTVCFFVGMALPHGSLLEDDVRVFLISSIPGLFTVIGWLVWAMRRARGVY